MIAKTILLALLATFLIDAVLATIETKNVVFSYKKNAILDCSKLNGNVSFFRQTENKTAGTLQETTQVEAGQVGEVKISIEDKKLTIMSLRGEQIKVKYYCTSTDGSRIDFVNQIGPYIYKPDKESQTASEGSSIEFKCTLLYGNETSAPPITWKWMKNDTEVTHNERTQIVSENGQSTLTIAMISDNDKGDFTCSAQNSYDTHQESIKLRVKDKYAALWPFLAIVAEVVVLCAIILIYEKKCSKKNTSNDDENEQAQNLMGNKDNQSSDLKKRTAKA